MELIRYKVKGDTVMGDLIKDCPPKKVAKEIVKEYDNV